MTELIVTRAVVALIAGCALLLFFACVVSEIIDRGNDLTADEDFIDAVIRSERHA